MKKMNMCFFVTHSRYLELIYTYSSGKCYLNIRSGVRQQLNQWRTWHEKRTWWSWRWKQKRAGPPQTQPLWWCRAGSRLSSGSWWWRSGTPLSTSHGSLSPSAVNTSDRFWLIVLADSRVLWRVHEPVCYHADAQPHILHTVLFPLPVKVYSVHNLTGQQITKWFPRIVSPPSACLLG